VERRPPRFSWDRSIAVVTRIERTVSHELLWGQTQAPVCRFEERTAADRRSTATVAANPSRQRQLVGFPRVG
jgi:hypothetical protein